MNISINVNGKTFTVDLNRNIEAIVLFGSCARGENDENSDIDFLFIIEDCNIDEYANTIKQLATQLNVPDKWLSVYRKSSIGRMNYYTSYFLWHIKLEGKVLFSKTDFLDNIFNSLNVYKKTSYDLMEYLVICNDIRSYMKNSKSIEYELNLLGSIVRNTCIAICYVNTIPCFGRTSSVIQAKKILKDQLPFTVEEYIQLYNYRLRYRKGEYAVENTSEVKEYILLWLRRIESVINITLNNIEKNRWYYGKQCKRNDNEAN